MQYEVIVIVHYEALHFPYLVLMLTEDFVVVVVLTINVNVGQ